MGDVKQYYKDLNVERAKLETIHPDGFCFVISENNSQRNSTAGTVAHVSVENAAKGIIKGTHRQASVAEIAKHHLREAGNKRLSEALENRFNGKVTVVMERRGIHDGSRSD